MANTRAPSTQHPYALTQSDPIWNRLKRKKDFVRNFFFLAFWARKTLPMAEHADFIILTLNRKKKEKPKKKRLNILHQYTINVYQNIPPWIACSCSLFNKVNESELASAYAIYKYYFLISSVPCLHCYRCYLILILFLYFWLAPKSFARQQNQLSVPIRK